MNDYEKYSAPLRKGPYLFFTRNAGLQNQSVLFIQVGRAGAPEVLIDPNTWSADGTVSLSVFVPSKDATYAVYGISQSGFDWHVYKVMDLASRNTLDDTIKWVKVSGVAWCGDGFFYSRYPAPPVGQEKASINENHQVFFHRIGTPQSQDRLIYETPPTRNGFTRCRPPRTSASRSCRSPSAARAPMAMRCTSAILEERDRSGRVHAARRNHFRRFVCRRRQCRRPAAGADQPERAELARRADPSAPGRDRLDNVLPERSGPLQTAMAAGGKLFVTYLEDVATRVYVHALDGSFENEVSLPGPGAAAGFDGSRDDASVFYTFNSLRCRRPSTNTTSRRAPAQSSGAGGARLRSRAVRNDEVFYTSRDGTRVPMFLVHRKGLTLDGNNPTLLYGDRGFNIVVAPTFSAARLAILERGVVFASANLRGGGEYGESWHQQGTKLRKQNVFDDFIAAAEWLVANNYTSPPRLAIQGGSNGGLLVGAVINQRPELFRLRLRRSA